MPVDSDPGYPPSDNVAPVDPSNPTSSSSSVTGNSPAEDPLLWAAGGQYPPYIFGHSSLPTWDVPVSTKTSSKRSATSANWGDYGRAPRRSNNGSRELEDYDLLFGELAPNIEQFADTKVRTTTTPVPATRTAKAGPPSPPRPYVDRLLRGLGEKLAGFTCATCYRPFNLGGAEVIASVLNMVGKRGVVCPEIKCVQCATLSCIGCGMTPYNAAKASRVESGKGIKASWCCDEGRLYLVCALFCGIEITGLVSSGAGMDTAPPATRKRRRTIPKLLKEGASHLLNKGAGPSNTKLKSQPQVQVQAEPQPQPQPQSQPQAQAQAQAQVQTPPNPQAGKVKVWYKKPPTGQPQGPPSPPPIPEGLAQAMEEFNQINQNKSFETKRFLPSGVGYGGSGIGTWNPLKHKRSRKTLEEGASQESLELESYELYFRALALLAPKLGEPGRFDQEPIFFELFCHMFARSPLIHKAAELLRNMTAMEDIVEHHDLYEGLLELLETLANHPHTNSMLSKPITLYPPEEQLPHFCLKEAVPGSGVSTDAAARPEPAATEAAKAAEATRFDQARPLGAILRETAQFCSGVLRQAKAHASVFAGDEDGKMLAICQKIDRLAGQCATWDAKRAYSAGSSPSASAGMGPAALEGGPSTQEAAQGGRKSTLRSAAAAARVKKRREEYEAWHREHCVLDCDDDKIMASSYFASQAAAAGTSLAPGRMRRLILDVNTLRCSLPEGIFVRHGTSRIDLMKVLIVGPRGTPYEGGLFEFDLFCPPQYPRVPPVMRLKTTGGGRIRFNPNLYHDGYVCLSLLGTWGHGQAWQPEVSTLLQVLVSIQSMIFVAEPWYNEPGHELHPDKRASDRHNKQVQGWTVEHAMLYWLDKLTARSGSGGGSSSGGGIRGGSSGSGTGGRGSINDSSAAAATDTPATFMLEAEQAQALAEAQASQAAAQMAARFNNVASSNVDMSIWEDVVRRHFTENGRAILETAKAWEGRKKLPELTAALGRWGFLKT